MRYLDRGDPARAASELEQLAVRLDEKIKLASVQLQLTRQQAATVHLLFGSLAKKVPQRTDQALAALKRALDLAPDDPDVHKEVGLLKKESGDLGGALECFDAYFRKARAARHLTDRELLEIDACRLAAECHRAIGSPDLGKERT